MRGDQQARQAVLVVSVNTVPWITKRDESTKEGWAPFARERRRIADAIVRLGLVERLVMLSGDAHMLAMDDGTHSRYYSHPEVTRIRAPHARAPSGCPC